MTYAYSALKLAACLPSLCRITAGAHYEKRIVHNCIKCTYCFCFRFTSFFFNLGSLISCFTLTILKTSYNLLLKELILTYRWAVPAEVKKWNNTRILINISRMNSGAIRFVKNVGYVLICFQRTGGQKPHLRPTTHIQNGSRHSLYLISVCFKVV